MKKLYNPLATGGAPVFTETLNNTELELWAAAEGILKHLDPTLAYPKSYQDAPSTNYVSTGIIVSGGDVTDNTTDWDLAAGIAYFPVAGRFARFAAEATIDNADYAMITLDSPVTTQKTFFDAANKDYFVDYLASVATLTPPAAEPGVEYVCVRKAAALDALPFSEMGHPSFGGILNQLNQLLNVGNIVILSAENNWSTSGSASFVALHGRFVQITIVAQSAASATDDNFTTIPYTPNIVKIGHAIGSTSGTIYPVHIDDSGNLDIIGAAGQTEATVKAQIDFLDI